MSKFISIRALPVRGALVDCHRAPAAPNSKGKRSATLGSLCLVITALTLFIGCGGGGATIGGGHASVASVLSSISISPTAATVLVGSTQQFQAVAMDQDGQPMPAAFTFSSSDNVATVSSTGLAKGMAAGTTTITANTGGKTASVSLTVVAAPPPSPVLTQISVSPSTASIQVGQQQSYTAAGYDQFNHVMSGVAFTWASDGSSSIATISGNVANGVSPGTVHVTASAAGVSSAPASLTVLPPPRVLTAIAVTPAASSISTGGTQQFTAVGYYQNGATVSGIAFAWSTSNQSVATINAAGLASGVSAGTTQIIAFAQGVSSGGATLTVTQPASVLTSIDASPTTASIQAGAAQQFTVVGCDQYGNAMTGITFAWSSSNANVATISGINAEGKTIGVASGIAAGSTQITVNAGGVTATVSLNVTVPPPPPPPPQVNTISVVSSNGSINVGGTQQLSAFATDHYGSAMSGATR